MRRSRREAENSRGFMVSKSRPEEVQLRREIYACPKPPLDLLKGCQARWRIKCCAGRWNLDKKADPCVVFGEVERWKDVEGLRQRGLPLHSASGSLRHCTSVCLSHSHGATFSNRASSSHHQ